MNKLLLLIAKVMNRVFGSGFQKATYFSAWNYIYRLGLMGMGRIQGNKIEHTGEEDVLRNVFLENQSEYTIIDVGANKGQYASAVLKQAKGKKLDFHLFEPSAVNGDILHEKLNQQTYPNVSFHINVKALGDKEETTYLYTDGEGSDIASLMNLKIQIRPFDDAKKETIHAITLDQYVESNNIQQIDLLKIDVEGFEYKVLQGAMNTIRSGKIKKIQFEFGAGNITARVFFHDFWVLLSDQYHFSQVLSGGAVPIQKYSNDWEIFKTTNYLLTLQ